MVLLYLGLDFFCSSPHALPAVISSVAFVSEGYACVIAAATVPQPNGVCVCVCVCVCPSQRNIPQPKTALFVKRVLRARKLDSSSAENLQLL